MASPFVVVVMMSLMTMAMIGFDFVSGHRRGDRRNSGDTPLGHERTQ